VTSRLREGGALRSRWPLGARDRGATGNGGGKSECELYGADEADERGKQGQGERFDATEIDL